MNIAIDGNEANVSRKVGISEYGFELLQQFKECQISSIRQAQDKNVKFQIYLKDKPRPELPEEKENWHYRIVKPQKLWTQIGLPFDLYIHKPRPDVFFSPTHYAPRFSPIPTVVSVMDLSYEYFPELFNKSDLYQLKQWTAYSIKNATRVLTISKSSKNDIIRLYKVPASKVVVTHLGIKSLVGNVTTTMDKLREKYEIGKEFVLFVGTLQPRKNIERLIEAFAKIAPEHEETELVIVGKPGWLYEPILAAPKKFGIEEKVKFISFIPDEELQTLYAHAKVFVLPSLYEGFGLPVLEAMAHGCPVVTSNISSLPEAGGDAALYVDPQDVGDIAEKIETVLTDEKLRKEMISKGKDQVKKFSWEKTARETLAVLMEVAG